MTIAFGSAAILFVLTLISTQKANKIASDNVANKTSVSTSPWSQLSIAGFAAGGVAVATGLILALH